MEIGSISAYNTAGETNGYTLPGQSLTINTRDAKGRIWDSTYTSTDANGVSTSLANHVTYDANDNLASVSAAHVPDAVVKYAYYGPTENSGGASPGAIKSATLMRGSQTLWTQTYTYDDTTKRLATVQAGGQTFTSGYKSGTDAIESLASAGVLTTMSGYDSVGRLSSLTQTVSGSTVYGVSYTYNDNDQRKTADVTYKTLAGAVAYVYWTFEYDADNADQLKSAKAYSDSARTLPIADKQFTYTFDGIGNRTDKAYAPNSDNQYTKNPDAGNATMTYNAQGDLSFDGVFTYTYDSSDRLTSATPVASSVNPYKSEYGYDAQDHRIWKKTYQWNTTTGTWELSEYRKFVYDGDNLIAEFVQDPITGLDRLSRTYAWGQDLGGGIGGLLSITTYKADGVHPDKTYIPLYDGGGNVTGLVDADSGNVVASYEYDPFGKTLVAQGDAAALAANPFKFSTKYLDAETGLYYYGMRYYSPQLGRWMTRDPMAEEGGVNLYAFVNNDPVNEVDPMGMSPLKADDYGKWEDENYESDESSLAREMLEGLGVPQKLTRDELIQEHLNAAYAPPVPVSPPPDQSWLGGFLESSAIPGGDIQYLVNTAKAAGKKVDDVAIALDDAHLDGFGLHVLSGTLNSTADMFDAQAMGNELDAYRRSGLDLDAGSVITLTVGHRVPIVRSVIAGNELYYGTSLGAFDFARDLSPDAKLGRLLTIGSDAVMVMTTVAGGLEFGSEDFSLNRAAATIEGDNSLALKIGDPNAVENKIIFENAEKTPAYQNFYDVVGHGDGFHIGVAGSDTPLTAAQLAERIAGAPDYYPGQPIRLISCWSGAPEDGLAAQLAKELTSLNGTNTMTVGATAPVVPFDNGKLGLAIPHLEFRMPGPVRWRFFDASGPVMETLGSELP